MISYSTERKNYWPYILERWLIAACVYAIIIIGLKLFLSNFKSILYWIVAGATIPAIIKWLDKEWVQDITIDENEKTITHHFRSPLRGNGEKVHILRDVQLYVKKIPKDGKPTISQLMLYKNRRQVLALKAREDGFTPETLEAIRSQLTQLGVPE